MIIEIPRLYFVAVLQTTQVVACAGTRNGVSAKELQRQLGVTNKCAWRIGHQIRELMSARDEANNPGPLSGHVEIDETYVGGKRKGKGQMGKKSHRTIVMGVLQRGGAVKQASFPMSNALPCYQSFKLL